MKTLFIIDSFYNPTSASTNRLLSFANAYAGFGYKVNVIFYSTSSANVYTKSTRNVEILVLCKSKKNLPALGKLFYTLKLIARLKSESLIVINSPFFLVQILCGLKKIKKYKIFHERTEYPELFISKNIFSKLYYSCYFNSCKKLDGLFVISHALKDYFVSVHNMPSSKVLVVNMTVDIDRFRTNGQIEKHNLITYIGTISENKDGILLLLQAVSIVFNIRPDYKLNIVGKFENKQVYSNVTQAVKKMGIESNVIYRGEVEPELIPGILMESKILVLFRPNNIQANYGFPTKLGEYLMSSTPVVLTDVGEIHRFLTNKKDAIICDPCEIDDFVNGILYLIENPDMAEEIGRNGKIVALNNFNSQVEARKVIEYICNIN